MQPSVPNSTLAELDLAVNDLGPLAWVLDELRKSLDGAAKALKRFVRDAEAARGSDLAALDASQLRIARQQLHQAVGALEMVGLAGPALVLRSMEAAVQKFLQHPEQCNQDSAGKIERASFALTEYLEAVLAGKPISAVSLFPQYRDVQELVRADRIHPADLWPFNWRWLDVELDSHAAPRPYDDEARAVMDRAVLPLMKGYAPQSAVELRDLSLTFAANQTERQPRTFWKIAAAYFEAVAAGVLLPDLYVRRATSRILLQYASLSRGDSAISERLAQDLLFFCAQAVAARASDTPVLSAVRAAYGLARFRPVDYELVQFGRFDPAVLAQARKRITSAKETWSSLSAGELGKFRSVGDQFSLVTDSLLRLHPPSEPLAQALTRAVETTTRSGQPPAIELAMEVATSVLYLEAVFDDLDPADPQLAVRTANLAERLEGVRLGGAPQPLEAWMEELYRRVSDKHTMGSVVGELRISLGELEKSLDQFFRNPQDKLTLQSVPGQLSQMRGVMSVLGLDQAVHAVSRMKDSVEEMLVTEVDEQLARAAGTFDHLGNNLGALSFLIDMLNYQPALAKKLFVYDEVNGELKPLMGRTLSAADSAPSAPAPADEISREVMSLVQAADAGQSGHAIGDRLAALATHAALADQPALAQSARDASAAVSGHDSAATEVALSSLASTLAPAPAPAVASDAVDFEEDDLQGIFLEEAGEVIGHGLEAVTALDIDPADSRPLTVLRRAFHTLKGSARMVGLVAYGDAAWSMEQLLNSWLADQKPASDELRALCTDAMRGFGRWADDIAANQAGRWSARAFSQSADALRLDGVYQALGLAVDGHDEPTDLLAATHGAASAFDGFEAFAAELPPADEAPAVDAHTTDAQPSSEEDTALELSATVPLVPAHEAPADVLSVLPDGDFDFDLDALEALAQPAPVVSDSTAVPADDEPLYLQDTVNAFDMDFEADVGEDIAQDAEMRLDFSLDLNLDAPAQPQASAPVDLLNIDGIDFDSLAALSSQVETEPALSVMDVVPADLSVAQAPTAEAPELDLSEADFQREFAQDGIAADTRPPATADAGADVDFDDIFAAMPSSATAPDAVAAVTEHSVSTAVPTDAPEVHTFTLAEPVETHDHALVATAHAEALDAAAAVEAHAQPVDEHPAHHEHAAGTDTSPAPQALLHADGGDDQIRVIGPLRIGIPLYNVYLNEADEWSRRLVTEIAEWALEGHQPVSESTVALAHSLAGASATVGFQALSGIARALESALQQSRNHHSTGASQYGQLFIDASEDIRRLLHQFAAGFLKEPDAALLDGLKDLEFNDSILPPAHEFTDADLYGHAPPNHAPALVAVPPSGARDWTPETGPADHAAAVPAVRLVWPVQPGLPSAAAVRFVREEDDDIDAVDAIDPDLFAIFEEEGAELMPQLGGALRQWSARPDNQSARLEVLRALHTLKGSARLAGALRLGEMAHRIETEIEHVGSEAAATQEFEPLLTRFDAMQVAFEGLRHPDDRSQASEDAASSPVPPAVQEAAPEAFSEPVVSPQAAPPEPGRKVMIPAPQAMAMQPLRQAANASVRVRSQLLDRMVNQAGEVMITRSRLEAELGNLRGSLNDMSGNLNRLRQQLRDIELQAETQMQSRLAQAKEAQAGFDPLEFDRFTRVQELTRMMAESVNDVATVQRTLQRTVEATEDDLIAQARQTRELQRDLLRTRMVEFEGIADRLYRVVRLASKETGKQVRLDLLGGTIEMDRGMLDRLTPAFEHLLRNCVAHGVESPEARIAAGKDPVGLITVNLRHEGNDVSVDFSDDGAGLDLARIRDKARSLGLLAPGQWLDDAEAANLIFMPGFSTASQVTELAGRGIGMDVVRTEINAIGGRIETSTVAGQGTHFKLVLPLTTAVTQVVMMRAGKLIVGVPANVVENVRRASAKELQQAYNSGTLDVGGEAVPFFWSGALLQASRHTAEPQGKTTPVVVFRSAAQRMALHVDEVLGNQEVVVKNLGPQLSRLPGLAGMSVLPSGAVVLIYNPVALASVYGEQARAWSGDRAEPHMLEAAGSAVPVVQTPAEPTIPLILVVDDSITVRRVTQRLLQREGYRVALAADGLQALERLQDEVPMVVLSDIEMPRMDGFDLARNIRADSRLAALPIIMITSRIAEKHREHARELGVDHYLGKPYSEDELMSLVRHYCAAEASAATATTA